MKVTSIAGEATTKALEDVISTAQKIQEELSRLTGKSMAVETVAEVTTAVELTSVAGEASTKALEDVISTAQKIQEELSRLTGKSMAVETVAEVTTAVELTGELSKKLQDELLPLTGERVLLRPNVDESILGGMIIRLGDKVIDCSVRYQLEQMRKKLAGK